MTSGVVKVAPKAVRCLHPIPCPPKWRALADTRDRDFRAQCRSLHARYTTARPYRPRTNGEAERFIETGPREWPYASAFVSSAQRANAMPA